MKDSLSISLLLLDMDGTVRNPKYSEKFISEPNDQELIKGVKGKIEREYSDWLIVGVTNQGGVKAGFKSLEDTIKEQEITLSLLPQLKMICFCPDDGNSLYAVHRLDNNEFNEFWTQKEKGVFAIEMWGKFRKPDPGMLFFSMDWAASGLWIEDNFYQLKGKENCLMIGDRPEDEGAASNAGIKFMWSKDWNQAE
jgi:D-glycero-D-manno-heptose 1,7-bisphosphate phosphatase